MQQSFSPSVKSYKYYRQKNNHFIKKTYFLKIFGWIFLFSVVMIFKLCQKPERIEILQQYYYITLSVAIVLIIVPLWMISHKEYFDIHEKTYNSSCYWNLIKVVYPLNKSEKIIVERKYNNDEDDSVSIFACMYFTTDERWEYKIANIQLHDDLPVFLKETKAILKMCGITNDENYKIVGEKK